MSTSDSQRSPASSAAPSSEFPRNVASARIWTAHRELILPADLSDALYARGFMPGFSDPQGETAPIQEAGLAEARFTPGGDGYRIVSLTSSRGNGCVVSVQSATERDLPDEYLARRAVPHPRLCYTVEAGGPSNSDRNLCENIAEALMLLTNGVVLIGGLGTKGNRPVLHSSAWVGQIKTVL